MDQVVAKSDHVADLLVADCGSIQVVSLVGEMKQPNISPCSCEPFFTFHVGIFIHTFVGVWVTYYVTNCQPGPPDLLGVLVHVHLPGSGWTQ